MLNHVFPDSPSNLLIYTRPCPMKDLSLRYKLATMEDKRFYYCNVKTLNLIPSVLASQRALEKGCDETVFHRGDLVDGVRSLKRFNNKRRQVHYSSA